LIEAHSDVKQVRLNVNDHSVTVGFYETPSEEALNRIKTDVRAQLSGEWDVSITPCDKSRMIHLHKLDNYTTEFHRAHPLDEPPVIWKRIPLPTWRNRPFPRPVPRDYRLTARFESADGRACRIWEERENGAKRLELCVAPLASVQGGADIVNGMKTLSQFRQGSNFAFGVDFGLSEWWPDIAHLGGIPLLIREYKYDSVVSEVLLTAIRQGVPKASLLDLPDGYQVQEGPDYAQWYVR